MSEIRQYRITAWDVRNSREVTWWPHAYDAKDALVQWDVHRAQTVWYPQNDGKTVPTCSEARSVEPWP